MECSRRLLKQEFFAQADQLKAIRKTVTARLIKEGLERQMIERIVLALNEACANIIQHGYKRPDRGMIGVEIFNDQTALIFRLTDTAPAVNSKIIKSRPLDELRPGGLGVHFINEIMDEVRFCQGDNGCGNITLLKKHIGRPP